MNINDIYVFYIGSGMLVGYASFVDRVMRIFVLIHFIPVGIMMAVMQNMSQFQKDLHIGFQKSLIPQRQLRYYVQGLLVIGPLNVLMFPLVAAQGYMALVAQRTLRPRLHLPRELKCMSLRVARMQRNSPQNWAVLLFKAPMTPRQFLWIHQSFLRRLVIWSCRLQLVQFQGGHQHWPVFI